MGERIIQPPFYNSGFYNTGAGGGGGGATIPQEIPEPYKQCKGIKNTNNSFVLCNNLSNFSSNDFLEIELYIDAFHDNMRTFLFSTSDNNLEGSQIFWAEINTQFYPNEKSFLLNNSGTGNIFRYNYDNEYKIVFAAPYAYINGIQKKLNYGSLITGKCVQLFGTSGDNFQDGYIGKVKILDKLSAIEKVCLIPCVDENNKAGFYDKITNQFFGNRSGTDYLESIDF